MTINPLHIMIYIGNAQAHLSSIVVAVLSLIISLYLLQKVMPLHISGIVAMLLTLTGLNAAEIIYGILLVGVQEMIGTVALYGLTVIGFVAVLVTIDSYYPFIHLDKKIVVCILLQAVAFYLLYQTGYFAAAVEWIKTGHLVSSDPANIQWLATKILSYCIPISVIKKPITSRGSEQVAIGGKV